MGACVRGGQYQFGTRSCISHPWLYCEYSPTLSSLVELHGLNTVAVSNKSSLGPRPKPTLVQIAFSITHIYTASYTRAGLKVWERHYTKAALILSVQGKLALCACNHRFLTVTDDIHSRLMATSEKAREKEILTVIPQIDQ